MASVDLGSLHDITLLRVTLDWDRAEAKFDLHGPDGAREIFAKGLRQFSLAREQPWGRSVSINGATLAHDAASGLYSVEIEMQSGDPIKVVCESFTD